MVINQAQLVCFLDDVKLPRLKTRIAVHSCIHCTAAHLKCRHLSSVIGMQRRVNNNQKKAPFQTINRSRSVNLEKGFARISLCERRLDAELQGRRFIIELRILLLGYAADLRAKRLQFLRNIHIPAIDMVHAGDHRLSFGGKSR